MKPRLQWLYIYNVKKTPVNKRTFKNTEAALW